MATADEITGPQTRREYLESLSDQQRLDALTLDETVEELHQRGWVSAEHLASFRKCQKATVREKFLGKVALYIAICS